MDILQMMKDEVWRLTQAIELLEGRRARIYSKKNNVVSIRTGRRRRPMSAETKNAIASQRDSLTSRRRSQAAKKRAKERMERGELPGFMKKKK